MKQCDNPEHIEAMSIVCLENGQKVIGVKMLCPVCNYKHAWKVRHENRDDIFCNQCGYNSLYEFVYRAIRRHALGGPK